MLDRIALLHASLSSASNKRAIGKDTTTCKIEGVNCPLLRRVIEVDIMITFKGKETENRMLCLVYSGGGTTLLCSANSFPLVNSFVCFHRSIRVDDYKPDCRQGFWCRRSFTLGVRSDD